MARGKTLGEMMSELRIAVKLDPNPALSLNMVPLLQQTLRLNQEMLYDEFDWPFLQAVRDIPLETGSRFYDFPDDLNLERVSSVDVLVGGVWSPVARGITIDDYGAVDSDENVMLDPVMRWDVRDTEGTPQIEVWPIPASNNQKLRITGIRNLAPLVADADRLELDSLMVLHYAAGEILAGQSDPASQVKFAAAKARKMKMQGRVTKTRSNSFQLGGSDGADGYDQRSNRSNKYLFPVWPT